MMSESEAKTSTDDEDHDLQELQKQVEKLETEVKALESSDTRSIYVGNVDYSVTVDDLYETFKACGTVVRATILCDKLTGHPKGYAFVEFKDVDAVTNALLVNGTSLKGRALKIAPKRTNVPKRGRQPHSRGAGHGAGAGMFLVYAPSVMWQRGRRDRRGRRPY